MTKHCVALDIGGTKIRGAIIDTQGVMVAANTVPTNAHGGRDAMLAQMHASIDALLVSAALPASTIRHCGISSAGVIDPHRAIVLGASDAMPGWVGVDFRAELGVRHGWHVVADNDVNCALIGERWRGVIAETPATGIVVMMTLGTGLGGALMIDGQLIRGRHFLTGHIGYNLVWDHDENRHVHAERFASGNGLGVIDARLRRGNLSSGREVIARLMQGDAFAQQALAQWQDAISIQLQNIHWLLDPAQVIIGGGMIDVREYWWPGLVARLRAVSADLEIIPAMLGNDAGVYGAAKLAWESGGA